MCGPTGHACACTGHYDENGKTKWPTPIPKGSCVLYQDHVRYVGEYRSIDKAYDLHANADCKPESLVPGSPYRKNAGWKLVSLPSQGSSSSGSSTSSQDVFEDFVPAKRCNNRGHKEASNHDGTTSLLHHCPISERATVIAALRTKVNVINDQHIEEQRAKGISLFHSAAKDTGPLGRQIREPLLKEIDKKARSQLRELTIYVGMSALLTVNAVSHNALHTRSTLYAFCIVLFTFSRCTVFPHAGM